MFFTETDRDNLKLILQQLQTFARDMLTLKTSIDKMSDHQDSLNSNQQRTIARLDLFIKEFESIRPLVGEIKHAVDSVNDHCKSTQIKKKK